MKPTTKMFVTMEKKLKDNSHKSGWEGCSLQYLLMCVIQEKKELITAIKRKKHPDEVWREAADIANFAMMIADNYEQEYHTNNK